MDLLPEMTAKLIILKNQILQKHSIVNVQNNRSFGIFILAFEVYPII
jgi:hypothetical protein